METNYRFQTNNGQPIRLKIKWKDLIIKTHLISGNHWCLKILVNMRLFFPFFSLSSRMITLVIEPTKKAETKPVTKQCLGLVKLRPTLYFLRCGGIIFVLLLLRFGRLAVNFSERCGKCFQHNLFQKKSVKTNAWGQYLFSNELRDLDFTVSKEWAIRNFRPNQGFYLTKYSLACYLNFNLELVLRSAYTCNWSFFY